MDNYNMEMADQTFDTLINETTACVYVVDCQTDEILALNETAADKINKNKEDIIGLRCYELFQENNHLCEDCPVKNKQFSDKKNGYKQQFKGYSRYFDEWLNVKQHFIKWHDGRNAVMNIYKDLSCEPPSDQDYEQSAVWNEKLALPTVSCLEKDLSKIPPDTAYTLVCFDIVSLRTINEGYGRQIGDRFLIAVRDWITDLELGQLYHLGSDEFGILIIGADMEAGQKAARHIQDRFEKPWIIGDESSVRNIFCAVSIGIVSDRVIHSPDDILNVVERVLKNASAQEQIAIYNEETENLLKHNLEIEISLKNCMINNMQGFSVHYQPIVSSITGLWCGAEALCRWTSPTLGDVSPFEFIPTAERLGLIGFIGEWILEESVKQCKAWQLDTHEEFFLDVNLSPVQLLDKNLDLKVLDILKRYDYPSCKLALEITESTQLNFNNHTLDALLRLHQHGIPIALDDFGTGYSSYNSLKNLPASLLKTEKAFLNDLENDEYLQHLLETMVSLAHSADMKLTAEGVETAEQMKILMDNKVDFVQGYLFSKPLPGEEFEKKLDNFYRKEENSAAGEYSRIDLNTLLSSENAYSLTPSLYRTLIRCMQILFNTPDINDGINAVLALIGEKLGVNRHVLFLRNSEDYTFTNTHEWCDEGTITNLGRYISIDIMKATPSFIPLFEKEGMIVSPDISALPEDIYQMFLEVGVRSNIAIPLWRGKELLGYIGLDVSNERRNWLPEEVLMVHSVSGILANVLDRIYLQDEIKFRTDVMDSVLNNLDIIIYISDLETDEILFANDTLRMKLGAVNSLKGKVCWQTVYNRKASRCPFCKLQQLLENPEDGPVVWEHVDEQDGKRYVVYDCLVQWKKNKKAHLQYAIDVTRFK